MSTRSSISAGWRRAFSLGCVGALGLLTGAIPTASAAAGSAVRVGALPRLPAASSILGSLAADTPLRVSVILRPRDPAALAAFVSEVSTPGSSLYGQYITPKQFAERFGATSSQVQAVRASLQSHGLLPGPVTVNSLSIPITTTAGELERVFSLSFLRLALPTGRTVIVNTAAPLLDRSIVGIVQSVSGLDTLASPRPLSIRPASPTTKARSAAAPHVTTGGPQPCAAARVAASGHGAYTTDQIASAYGFSGLYGAGDQGAGQTIALYELEANDTNDIAAFQSCYGTHAPVSYVPVDGGAGAGAGSGEAALDIEQAIGLSPLAHFIVYQGPNSSSNGPGSGPYDTFSAIITENRARVISTSWGICEASDGSANALAESTLFQEAAAQGQTIMSAAGDQGSEDCNLAQGTPNSALAVDDPASQPYVTGVGGTTLSSLGPRPSEQVWNSGGGLLGGLLGSPGAGAGGGGVSGLWGMPAYQSSAPSFLHLISSGSSGAGCGGSGGYCRQVPDVSANADPRTGYLIYFNGAGSVAKAPSGWQGIAGTSAGAPLWAAAIALANASRGCAGSSIGFANPALYKAAASAYGNNFNDVVSGNNDFTGLNGGNFAAGPGYDMASGLGTPNVSALAAAICAGAIRISAPGAQRSTVHSAVALRLRASGGGGAALGYAAAGLPPGLAINRFSGQIAGRPQTVGSFEPTITVADRYGAVGKLAFSWIIGRAPTASRVIVDGLANGRPRLSFSVRAGRGALPLRQVVLIGGGGLHFSSAGGLLSVTGPGGRHLRFRVSTRRGVLTIRLLVPARLVRITVSYPRLTADAGLAAALRAHRTRTLTALVRTTGSELDQTRLRLRVR